MKAAVLGQKFWQKSFVLGVGITVEVQQNNTLQLHRFLIFLARAEPEAL